jgi:HPt (histidine-containing phosphotransfer) domain-containing protein
MIDNEAINSLKDLMGDGFGMLLDKYVSGSQELMSSIKEGVKEHNANKIKLAAHPFKSSSAQFGATELSSKLAQMELQAIEGKHDFSEEEVNNISTLFDDAIVTINTMK